MRAFAVDAASRRFSVSDDNGNLAGYPCLTNSLPLRQIGFTKSSARHMATTKPKGIILSIDPTVD